MKYVKQYLSETADLSKRYPGKLNYSRWLTAANRILRLYVGTDNPSSKLKILTEFVMQVYAPMWFIIKFNPSCKNGANHVWQTIKRSRYLKGDLKSVIDEVIQRNAYFLHPENLLLCMLSEDRCHIKQLALRRILNAKEKEPGNVRSFVVPKINFDADEHIYLIDWQQCEVTVLPVFHNLESEEIQMLIKSEDYNHPLLDILSYPCHIQAVERCVKLVTGASSSVMGVVARDGFIRATIDS